MANRKKLWQLFYFIIYYFYVIIIHSYHILVDRLAQSV